MDWPPCQVLPTWTCAARSAFPPSLRMQQRGCPWPRTKPSLHILSSSGSRPSPLCPSSWGHPASFCPLDPSHQVLAHSSISHRKHHMKEKGIRGLHSSELPALVPSLSCHSLSWASAPHPPWLYVGKTLVNWLHLTPLTTFSPLKTVFCVPYGPLPRKLLLSPPLPGAGVGVQAGANLPALSCAASPASL